MIPAPSLPSTIVHAVGGGASVLWGEVSHVLLAPGSPFSLLSLACALIVAVVVFARQRWSRGRRITPQLLLRAIFPRRILRSASSRADAGFMLLNIFATGALIGWALISYAAVSHWAQGGLTGLLGSHARIALPAWLIGAGVTVVLFLVYELAYWLDHWLSHTVPFLWEFHRVHHTAETLSPLTVFRVHPIESLKFANISALLLGLTHGAATWLVGAPVHEAAISGGNVILLAFIFTTIHLQHSHVWIAFTGAWGRIFASPAHHQIHHSADPAHFGKNLGSCLVLFDWLFGTLRIPTRDREPLVFGVEPGQESPHTVVGGLVTPFARAASTLRPAEIGEAAPARTPQGAL
jgi:sterol desaturase/sphingolipid hydroxylase (fatty acid hydroxylase superfamily)